MTFSGSSRQNSNVLGYILESLTTSSTEAAIAAARELLIEYGRFVQAQPAIATFCYADLEVEAAELPHSYLDAGGGSLLAVAAGKPVGFVAWRNFTDPELASAFEIKRLWVRPAGRGLGIGRALIQSLEKRARATGKTLLLLDTAPESMPAAYHLYQEMGFRDCPSYIENPSPGIVYMRKEL